MEPSFTCAEARVTAPPRIFPFALLLARAFHMQCGQHLLMSVLLFVLSGFVGLRIWRVPALWRAPNTRRRIVPCLGDWVMNAMRSTILRSTVSSAPNRKTRSAPPRGVFAAAGCAIWGGLKNADRKIVDRIYFPEKVKVCFAAGGEMLGRKNVDQKLQT